MEDEQHLREKARLLLQRERELFDLRLKHEQIAVWLGIGQTLPELFLRGGNPQEIWNGLRRTLITKLGLQRVVLLEVCPAALRPLAPAGPERPVAPEVHALLEAQPSGWCNDPQEQAVEAGLATLADALGLHRFMWSKIARAGAPPILIAAGFDRGRAAFQSRLVQSDAAHFENAAQQVESLLGNALLVAELEREKDQLRQANSMLEQRDLALRGVTEQLRAANENLEQRVRERTRELTGKNRELRLVLDNVDQALVSIDLQGRLAPARSRMFDGWFGAYAGNPSFVEHVVPGAKFAQAFRLGLESLRDDILPRELCLDQMPRRFAVGTRQLECRYLPIEDGEALVGLLMVIDDVTEHLARARQDAEQRELLSAFMALMRDRGAFLAFCGDAERTLAELTATSTFESAPKLALHTLKGNAATLRLSVIAELCHRLESELASHGTPMPETLAQLRARWDAIIGTVRAVVPAELDSTIQVSERDLARLTEQATAGATARQILEEIRQLGHEPVERSLSRLAQSAQRLASRLGRTLEVVVDADELLLDPTRWAPLWSALIHLARNAVDHGIEPPEERQQRGKATAGSLRLCARRREAGFVLEVSDDGRGIDWDIVRARCRERGLPAATERELIGAILSPGFSTGREVTETSGRGVGLAAVASSVRAFGGELSVESAAGTGTRWTLAFPSAQ